MIEAETTAVMGRRCWPQLRAGARAGERARAQGGGRGRTRAHACPRVHAREAEPTKYAVVSKPDRP